MENLMIPIIPTWEIDDWDDRMIKVFAIMMRQYYQCNVTATGCLTVPIAVQQSVRTGNHNVQSPLSWQNLGNVESNFVLSLRNVELTEIVELRAVTEQ